jgi:hypothetical protein
MSTDESDSTPNFKKFEKSGLSLLFELADDFEPCREDIIKLAGEDKDSVLNPRATALAHCCFKIARTLFLVNDARHKRISTLEFPDAAPEVAPPG